MKQLAIIILFAMSTACRSQSLPSPEVSSALAGTVMTDYLKSQGFTSTPGAIIHQCSNPTNVVVVALPNGIAVPTWTNLFTATNVTAAFQREKTKKASLQNMHPDARAVGLSLVQALQAAFPANTNFSNGNMKLLLEANTP